MSDHISSVNSDWRRDKIGIAFGSFGANLCLAVLMTYLTVFLTDNMLIPAASVSLILLVSRIIDAFSDLWVGLLIDRCKSKMGKARPWLLWMAAPAAISMVLLFIVPPLNVQGRIIYSFITYNLVAFFYLTALTLPMNALVSLVTTNTKHRLVMSQIFGLFSTLGAVFVNFFSTPIMDALGGGNSGYLRYFSIIAVIGVGFCLICFKLTKEKAHEKEKDNSKSQEKLGFKTGAAAVLRNIYWWHAMGIFLLAGPPRLITAITG